MKRNMGKRILALSLAAALALTINGNLTANASETDAIPDRVAASDGVKEIPGTTSSFDRYNNSFLSATGFAAAGVHDRSEYVGTSYYRQVSTGKDFIQALYDAQQGTVKVIEIMKDLNLGYGQVTTDYSSIFTKDSMNVGYMNTNPLIEECGGVSKIKIDMIDGLTIFSQYGATLNHTQLDVTSASNDIVIRNIAMDGIWQWDNTAHHKESGFTCVKVNGTNVWIDHCSFTIAPDGNIDLESGANGVTLSWCKFGIEVSEAEANENIHDSILFMEEMYQQDVIANEAAGRTGDDRIYTFSDVNGGNRYATLRAAGATPEEIMQYTAFHSKVHLVGSGDKDIDVNPQLQITLAYNWYRNIAQRVPMVRQGTGHMYNCYIDDMDHLKLEQKFKTDYNVSGQYTLSRCINARNGASIAADTCEFYGINQPVIGAELQGDDKANMNAPWDKSFENTYNHSLVVNSKTTNSDGQTYIGSSWDNAGENQFTNGFNWHDKSTIGHWCWRSTVTTKFVGDTYDGVFNVEYDYNAALPYSYQMVPLEDVKSVVTSYSGEGVYDLTPAQWLQTSYSKDEQIEPAGENKVYIAGKMEFADEEPVTYVGDKIKLDLVTKPVKVTNPVYAWSIKSTGTTKASINAETGEITALAVGKATVTCKMTSVNGTSVTANVTLSIKKAADKPSPEPTTTPEVTDEPTTTPQVTDEPTTTPQVTDEPTTTPQVTDEPTATPQVTDEPTATPQVTDEPTATPEVTDEPTTTPEVTDEPTTSPEVTDEPSESPVPEMIMGDLNGDKAVDLSDAQEALKISLGIIQPTDLQKEAADVNFDGNVDLLDAQEILKAALGISKLSTKAEMVATAIMLAVRHQSF